MPRPDKQQKQWLAKFLIDCQSPLMGEACWQIMITDHHIDCFFSFGQYWAVQAETNNWCICCWHKIISWMSACMSYVHDKQAPFLLTSSTRVGVSWAVKIRSCSNTQNYAWKIRFSVNLRGVGVWMCQNFVKQSCPKSYCIPFYGSPNMALPVTAIESFNEFSATW